MRQLLFQLSINTLDTMYWDNTLNVKIQFFSSNSRNWKRRV